MTRLHLIRSTCRACEARALQPVCSLGEMLDLAFCRHCSLLQTLQTVSPTLLYDEAYLHFSSSVPGIEEHSRRRVDSLIVARGLNAESLVVELGSNDGYLLRHFAARNIPVLGIEPAPRQAQMARRAGVPTLGAFFGLDLAHYLRREGRTANVIIANNVLGKVPDLHGFLAAIRTLLSDDGTVTLESPYVRSLVDECALDAIHLGQISFWGAWSLDQMARSEGMYLNHVEMVPTNPGVIRYQLGKSDGPSAEVLRYLRAEQACGLTEFAYYREFGQKADAIRQTLLAQSRPIRRESLQLAARPGP